MSNNINDTWDLTKIFNTENEFKNAIKTLEGMISKFESFKGHILDSSESLYNFLTLESDATKILEKVYVYAHLGYYGCMNDSSWQEKTEEAVNINDKLSVSSSFASPEILKSDYKDILEFINEDDRLKEYAFKLELMFRYKDHTLSEKEEKLLSELTEIFRTPESSFLSLNNKDIKLGKIKDEDGKWIELTNSNYTKYISSKSRTVRKSAFNKMYKFYESHINTIASLYIANVKSDEIYAKIKNYKNSLISSLYGDNIDLYLYENLIKVNNENLNLLKEYYKLKTKALRIKKMHMYDTYANASVLPEKVIPYEKAKNIIIDALEPLGEEYIKNLTNIMNTRCIDVYPRTSKKSGAYQWGTYKTTYVSLNYENNVDSVSTAAHELGHAMHSYYSDTNQSFEYAGYPIFLAEIASTVNEILLTEYLYKNANTNDEKIYYLSEFLDKFKATVFRQTMFAEFEYNMHEIYKNSGVLTKDMLCDEYYKLNKKNFEPIVNVNENIKYEWARIPHFYNSFYVYKYATGFISAVVIANKLLSGEEGFRERYIKFLSSGGSDYPLNILKELGINIEDEDTLNGAYKVFESKLNMLKKLTK